MSPLTRALRLQSYAALLVDAVRSPELVALDANVLTKHVAHGQPFLVCNLLQPSLFIAREKNFELETTIRHARRVQGRYTNPQGEKALRLYSLPGLVL